MSSPDPGGDNAILTTVGDYYSDKVATHGATPRGVDWRDAAGQHKRFEQLLRRFDLGRPFTIGEVGCGYGALVQYLRQRNVEFSYVGCDVSPEMISRAQALYKDEANVAFELGTCSRPADYIVASGIFNVRFGFDEEQWSAYVLATIEAMVGLARRGSAFNFLTGFSDEDRKEARLWYPDPGRWLDLCLSRYGRNVTLFHDYGLYEFTIAVGASGETA